MTRSSRETWAMELARVTAGRSTCLRRHVGCILLDKDWHVLSTGVNGVANGQPHCNQEVPVWGPGGEKNGLTPDYFTTPHECPGAHAASGSDLDGCYAIHAEQNALLQCPDVRQIHVCVCTASPCISCVKLLMNTGCKVIIFEEAYPHNKAQDLWLKSGGLWQNFGEHYVR